MPSSARFFNFLLAVSIIQSVIRRLNRETERHRSDPTSNEVKPGREWKAAGRKDLTVDSDGSRQPSHHHLDENNNLFHFEFIFFLFFLEKEELPVAHKPPRLGAAASPFFEILGFFLFFFRFLWLPFYLCLSRFFLSRPEPPANGQPSSSFSSEPVHHRRLNNNINKITRLRH